MALSSNVESTYFVEVMKQNDTIAPTTQQARMSLIRLPFQSISSILLTPVLPTMGKKIT